MAKSPASKITPQKDKSGAKKGEETSLPNGNSGVIENDDLLKSTDANSTDPTVESKNSPEVVEGEISKETDSEVVEEAAPSKISKDLDDVPKVDNNAPLNIEGLTTNLEVPEVSKNAKLKFEDAQENADLRQEKAGKTLMIMGIIGVFLTVFVIVGFYLLFIRTQSKQQVLQVEPQVIETKQQTENVGGKINRAEWTLEVLNGSGVAGAAKTVALKLENSGYKVVKTGNADKADYGKTTLFVATNLKDKESLVLGDLRALLGVVESGGELLSSTASARLVVGKD